MIVPQIGTALATGTNLPEVSFRMLVQFCEPSPLAAGIGFAKFSGFCSPPPSQVPALSLLMKSAADALVPASFSPAMNKSVVIQPMYSANDGISVELA